MINILQYIPSFQVGGIESFLLALDSNKDDEFKFIYLVENPIPKEYEKQIKKNGSKIIYLPYPGYKSPRKIYHYLKELKRIIMDNNINVLHSHIWSSRPYIIPIALLTNVKVRIAHSHSKDLNSKNKFFLQKFLLKIGVLFSNVYIGCSEDACKFAFKNRKYTVLYNGISFDKYKYDKKVRMEIRKNLNIGSETVFINVGRFCELKNQMFLVDVFNELHKEYKNSKLLLIGQGPDVQYIRKKIQTYDLSKYIMILENINNPVKFLNAADCFVFPSSSEGLGISYLEAQATGIKCVISTGVPDIGTFTKNILKLDLKEGSNEWSKQIITFLNEKNVRKSEYCEKFDVKITAKIYQEIIRKEMKKHER